MKKKIEFQLCADLVNIIIYFLCRGCINNHLKKVGWGVKPDHLRIFHLTDEIVPSMIVNNRLLTIYILDLL